MVRVLVVCVVIVSDTIHTYSSQLAHKFRTYIQIVKCHSPLIDGVCYIQYNTHRQFGIIEGGGISYNTELAVRVISKRRGFIVEV